MVIDANIYLTYITYRKLYRLVNAISSYDLEVFVNEELINEIARNAIKVSKDGADIDYISSFVLPAILSMTTKINTSASFSLSPDKKDNFLFDIAIQTNSRVIVTQEKALLGFMQSPVPIRNLKWFKETYPVPL